MRSNPQRVQHGDHLLGIFRAEPAALEIRRVELDRHGEFGAHGGTHLLDHVHQDARAVLDRSAPAVLALVRDRRQELAEQVAMGGMDLHAVEAELLGQHGGMDEAVLDFGDVCLVHLLRWRELLGEVAKVHRQGGWGDGGLAQRCGHLAPGMVDLHPDLRSAGAGGLRPLFEAGPVLLGFEHDPARTCHRAAVDHHVAGDHQADFTFGPRAIETDQLVGGGVVCIRKVLFHGGLGQAIGDQGAVGQGQRGEGCHHRVPRFRHP